MPKDQKMLGARQRPVSCRFCRSRKLRCSREAPCSNCISRGIRCELQPSPATTLSGTASASESQLLERIRKLEALVEKQKFSRNQSTRQHSESAEIHAEHAQHAQQAQGPTLSPQIEHLNNDAAWLESIYSGQNSSCTIPTNKVVFRICPIQIITDAQPYIDRSACLSQTLFEPTRCVWLPQYSEARILLDKFIQDIDHVHHVVHTPSLPAILEEVYSCLNQQSQVKSGNIILLLSIFSSSTHSWIREDSKRGLFSTCGEANNQAPLWVKAIEDVLDISHRTASISLEGVQGIAIVSFVLLNMEGFSRRCRALFNLGYSLARELGLHCLDHPSNAKLLNSPQTEMGRRVWWFLVASDWTLPSKRFHGVSQGFYNCHPRHMLVKKPLNLNDEDLIEGMSRIEKPLSQPTSMSYSLQRIRLSEISRNMVDRNHLIMAQASGPSHDVVMDTDTELQTLINDTPPFFSMSVAELTATYQLDASQAEKIAAQGYTAYSLIYAYRCTLHFPFFTRGFTDSAFASSREICLQSARRVIRVEIDLGNSGLPIATRFKFLGLLIAIFMATIVVLMDVCHNKSSSQQKKEVGEITDAIRILEEARLESETAAKFLDSMMQVLKKYNVCPSQRSAQQPSQLEIGNRQHSPSSDRAVVYRNTTTQSHSVPTVASTSMALCEFGSDETQSMNIFGGGISNGADLTSYFNELAQTFEKGIDSSVIDWNNIFSDLDSSLN